MNNMKVAAMKIMESAYKQRWVMAGGIYIAMNELPKGSAPFSYRVGVPMKLPKNASLTEFTAQVEKTGYTVLEMPAGEYVHALTNAEPGTASVTWTKVLTAVAESGLPFNGPYFEYHSDSRNAEMTTVISQSHLVFKAQGEQGGTVHSLP
jgi:effector-binding domain-containing protein